MTSTPLSARLQALESQQRAIRCSVGRFLDGLDIADREQLERLMARPAGALSTRVLHAELKGAGVAISRDTLGLHRQGRCTCRGAE